MVQKTWSDNFIFYARDKTVRCIEYEKKDEFQSE